MPIHPRVERVGVEGAFHVRLTFSDGSTGTVNLAPWIQGRGGVFAALQDPAFFARVFVDTDAGTIAWPNGVDLDPDMLFEAAQATASR